MPVDTLTAPIVSEAHRLAELEADQVYDALGASPGGLSADQAAVRLRHYGPNSISSRPPHRWLYRLGSNFVHVMAILLWVGGAVALAAGLPQLAVAIWIVNVINGLFSFWQEYRAEKATEALLELMPTSATALRDGIARRMAAADLVPGDVVLIEEGDRISADGRLVEHVSLRVDQSTLTGESRLVRKASEPAHATELGRLELPNIVYAGTTVAAGRGKLVVSATGSQTEFGTIASLTQSLAEVASPLQRELRHLSLAVSGVAIGAGVLFFLMALALGDLSPTRGFVFALGMIVAFVPEGLLPTVTLALAMGTQRMAARNALVKKLSAVESLGCTTVICTDKTGTLTQNEMTVRTAVTGDRVYQLRGVGYSPAGEVDPAPDPDLLLMLESAALACNARLSPGAEGWVLVGDPTEGAILSAAMKAGIDLDDLTARRPRLLEMPFDPGRKRMSVVDRAGGVITLSTKGAPAELLARSLTWRVDGRSVPLESADRSRLGLVIDQSAAEGLRVLGVARRRLESVPAEDEDVEADLEFLGLVAMHDPPRPEVESSIATCRKAGIRIVMITGDYGMTAEAIGRRIGMIPAGPVRVINGDELDSIGDDELSRVVTGDVLFARATPEHKLRIVTALQHNGQVVAVTGDGVNDAPALKRADIGVAMGKSGTDVAREAADIILLDDNFASIVSAVEEGRAVYDNIKKFTTYILTSNTPEAVPFIAFAFSGGRIPIALDVMHILAIDLGTDLAPALALGAERPEPDVMDRPPRSLDAHLIDRRLLARAYLWLGPLQAAFVMAAFFVAYRLAGMSGWLDLPDSGTVYRSAAAMALAAVVATQIGNLFAQRSERVSLFRIGLGGNRLLWWGILSELVVIVLIVYVPGLQDVIGTAPFPFPGWLLLLLGVPLLPLADEVRKAVRRRRRTRCGSS